MVRLRKNEQQTLLTIAHLGGKAKVSQIVATSNLSHAAVMRAALTLSKEKLLQIHEQKQTIAWLTKEGEIYEKNGLPERCLIESLNSLGGKAKIDKTVKNARLEGQRVPIALGWLLRKGWATIERKENTLTALKKPQIGIDEEVMTLIARADKGRIVVEELEKKERGAIATLRKRKLLAVEEKILRTLEISVHGQKLLKKGVAPDEEVSQLTPELIVSKKWRTKKLRKFNVTAPGEPIYPGKIHPLQQIIERARKIFLEMGFTEIRGPLVETAFWNFDALFQPQDHPAREMHDTFYLSVPKAGQLPNKKVVDAVTKTHENGWTTGSKGWGYPWNAAEGRRLVLRTHTTAETIKYLSAQQKPPIKVFSVDRVYRNEQLTYKNTAEFHQIEGIVMDKGATLRDLMGTLKTFYERFGLETVQFWPSYFPYTEPSAQAMVYVPKLHHWIELCGMGMFRPEVLAPMNIKHPVLAWGGGLDRLAMVELGLDDIRLLHGNRLGWIRRTPACQ